MGHLVGVLVECELDLQSCLPFQEIRDEIKIEKMTL